MKTNLLNLILLLLLISCSEQPKKKSDIAKQQNIAIVIHGGAGYIDEKTFAPEEEAYKKVLENAIKTGYNLLKEGGSSLDAVEKTISILEDSPLFNAGKGAVFTYEETNELDASIMNGKTKAAGAITGVKTIKNPIKLARKVMENSKHVLLSREGAEMFALENGLEIVSPEYFYVEKRMKALKNAKERDTIELDHSTTTIENTQILNDHKHGTVGCVALDKQGNLSAGTSTGGMTNKRWGRVGDSPIIGAGTYANNNTCAVSATGWGEFFIRGVVCYDISALMTYKNFSLKEATHEVIQNKLTQSGGTGGVIALDNKGNISLEFNTKSMFRASVDTLGNVDIQIFKK